MADFTGRWRPSLVVTRTPLRVSFAGGGTDLPSFYSRGYGAVLNTAINKYVYVTVKPHGEAFDEPIRLNYSKSERVEKVSDIENNIARECLRFLQIDPPIYISTIGDLPTSTGLGGSSAFAVGLLNALHAYRGERVGAGQLAEEAAHIEIDVLRQPIGKQDQYAAAYGGLNVFRFEQDGSVTVEAQRLDNGTVGKLFDCIMMFWTGHQHDSGTVMSKQEERIPENIDSLCRMREHVHCLRHLVTSGNLNLGVFGRILHESWYLKRGLASTVTTPQIDEWYDRALAAGAEGGKLCGAGGGGFLLFLVEPRRQPRVRAALDDLKSIQIRNEAYGSQVMLGTNDNHMWSVVSTFPGPSSELNQVNSPASRLLEVVT